MDVNDAIQTEFSLRTRSYGGRFVLCRKHDDAIAVSFGQKWNIGDVACQVGWIEECAQGVHLLI